MTGNELTAAVASLSYKGNTQGDPQTIHLFVPSSAPCACLRKHTYSSLHRIRSTSELRYASVFLRVHACFNTCRSKRATISCVLLLYGMHSVATLLHACTGCPVVTIQAKIISLLTRGPPHAPSLPLPCPTSTVSNLRD